MDKVHDPRQAWTCRPTRSTLDGLELLARYYAARGHKSMIHNGKGNRTKALEELVAERVGEFTHLDVKSALLGIRVDVDASMPQNEIRLESETGDSVMLEDEPTGGSDE